MSPAVAAPPELEPLVAPEPAIEVVAKKHKARTRSPAERIFERIRKQVRDVFPDDDEDAWSFTAEDFEEVSIERPANDYAEWFDSRFEGSDDFSKLFTKRMFMVWEQLETEKFVVNGDVLWEHQKALFAWAALNICTGSREEMAQLLIRSPYGSGKSKVSGLITRGFRDAQLDLMMLQGVDHKAIPTGVLVGKKKEHMVQNAKGMQVSVLELDDLSNGEIGVFWKDLNARFGADFNCIFHKPTKAKDPFYEIFRTAGDDDAELLPIGKRIDTYCEATGRQIDRARGKTSEVLDVMEKLANGEIVLLPNEENIPEPKRAQLREDNLNGDAKGLKGDSACYLTEAQHYRIKTSHRHLAPNPKTYSARANPEDPAQYAIVHGSTVTRTAENIRRDMKAEITSRCIKAIFDEAGLMTPGTAGDSIEQHSGEWPIIIGMTGQDKGVRGWQRSPTISEAAMIRMGLMKPIAYTGIGDAENPPSIGSEEAWEQYKPSLFEDRATAEALGVDEPHGFDIVTVLKSGIAHEYTKRIRIAHEKRGIPLEVFLYHPDAKDKKMDILKAFKAPKEDGDPRRILIAVDTEIAEAFTIPNAHCYDIVDHVFKFPLDQIRGRLGHIRNLTGSKKVRAKARTVIRQQWLHKGQDPYIRLVAKKMGYHVDDEDAMIVPLRSIVDRATYEADGKRRDLGDPIPIPDVPKARRRKQRKKGPTPEFVGRPLELTNKYAQEKKRQKDERDAKRLEARRLSDERSAERNAELEAARKKPSPLLPQDPFQTFDAPPATTPTPAPLWARLAEPSSASSAFTPSLPSDEEHDALWDTDKLHADPDTNVPDLGTGPTVAKPGSDDKIEMMALRYASGQPLWHDGDCSDHGPGEDITGLGGLGGRAGMDWEDEEAEDESGKRDENETGQSERTESGDENGNRGRYEDELDAEENNSKLSTVVNTTLLAIDTSQFPEGWDERMDLNEPLDLWDEEGVDGHPLKSLRAANNSFVAVQKNTKTMLPKIIARQRWSTFGWTIEKMATEVGCSENGYRPMETDIRKRILQRKSYHRLLANWRDMEVSPGLREQCLDLITMPELFEQPNPKKQGEYKPPVTLLQKIEDVRNDPQQSFDHTHMIAFYHRIGWDVGHHTINSKIWARQHTRGDIGTVPNAAEVLEFVDAQYAEDQEMCALRRAEGIGIWTEVKKNQYRNRGTEEPLIELLVSTELHLADNYKRILLEDNEKTELLDDDGNVETEPMTLTAEAVKGYFSLGDLSAQLLAKSELIAWEEIEAKVGDLMPPEAVEALEPEWKLAHAAEQQRDGFRNYALAAMNERGYSFRDVSDLLELEIQEDNRQKGSDERTQRDRPESQIREIILHNRQSSLVAIESLLRVLARDEAHYQQLRKYYEDERARYYPRQGERLKEDGLKMRVLRELAGISMKNLALHFLPKNKHQDAGAVRAKDIELQKLERQEGKRHSIKFNRVYRILGKIIEEKAGEAASSVEDMHSFPKKLEAYVTVEELAANCIQGMRGARYVREAMEHVARNKSEWLSSVDIQRVADGKLVPPLPCLRAMGKGTNDKVLTPAVVRDWYERFPYQLAKGSSEFSRAFKFQSPLGRCLCTMIGSLDANLINFFDRVDGIVNTHGTDLLRKIEQGADLEKEWGRIRKIVRGVGYGQRDVQWKFAEALCQNKQNVDDAVVAILPVLQRDNLEVHPMNLPGMTMQELEEHQQKED